MICFDIFSRRFAAASAVPSITCSTARESAHGCQLAIARFLDPMCLVLRASGLWLIYATLCNLPSGNLDSDGQRGKGRRRKSFWRATTMRSRRGKRASKEANYQRASGGADARSIEHANLGGGKDRGEQVHISPLALPFVPDRKRSFTKRISFQSISNDVKT